MGSSSKEKLIDAILELVRETGYKKATTKEIAKRAEVNELTLFRIFGNKKQLLLSAINARITDFDTLDLQQFQQYSTLDKRVEAFLTAFCSLYIEHIYISKIFMVTSFDMETADIQNVFEKTYHSVDSIRHFFELEYENGNIRSIDFATFSELIFSTIMLEALQLTAQKADVTGKEMAPLIKECTKYICQLLQK